MNDNEPIFVGGPNRSGTSLMYALLASHPNISMVQRTDMWRLFYKRYGDLRRPECFERCLQTMLRYRRITRLAPDPDRVRLEFREGPPTYGRLFALLHAQHAERAGKQRWGDKSLHTEHHADQIFAEFPQAKVIQVIRDPRDRYASAQKRVKAGVASATGKWRSSIRAARRGSRRYPDRFCVVRYESLASRPESTLRRVCKFLGEPYAPEMLGMEGAPDHLAQKGDSAFGTIEAGEISTRSIGRFREVVSPRDLAFIQLSAGRDMAEFGYSPVPVPFSTGEWLSFGLVHLPLLLTRMTGWSVCETVRATRGRTVPNHRLVPGAAA